MRAHQEQQGGELQTSVKMFILAGEASGDIIGADLIKQMRSRVDFKIEGVGGKNMEENGLRSIFPITDLSVMGYVDVFLRLPLLLWRVRQVINHITKTNPDVVVLIDSQVFSNLVARGLKKRHFTSPILLYVCPTVWGYKPERAKKIKAFYDEVLAILPFEPAVMQNLNGPPCRFVGHPALEQYSQSGRKKEGNRIVLMPGSRPGELRRHLPMLRSVCEKLAQTRPELEFCLITLPHLVADLSRSLADWSVPVLIVSENSKRAQIFSESRLAIVVAGTATLELAVSNVPMIVSYVMDMGQLRIKNSIDLKHFALPNLILDEALVPELLLEKPDPEQLLKLVQDLLDSPETSKIQLSGFSRMRKKMLDGTKGFPRHNAADCVLLHLG